MAPLSASSGCLPAASGRSWWCCRQPAASQPYCFMLRMLPRPCTAPSSLPGAARPVADDDRRSLLLDNQVLAARHFSERFQILLHHLTDNDDVIGHVTDWFWRVEFQRRGRWAVVGGGAGAGVPPSWRARSRPSHCADSPALPHCSPHIHMLVWIENSPNCDERE